MSLAQVRCLFGPVLVPVLGHCPTEQAGGTPGEYSCAEGRFSDLIPLSPYLHMMRTCQSPPKGFGTVSCQV
jgi:hypothetical protein